MKKYTLIVVILLACWLGNAQTAKYSNEFLSLGVGAKGLSMANALVSITDDVHAAYWNPQ
jgi:hypothetical protein